MKKDLIIVFLMSLVLTISAQVTPNINPDLLNGTWLSNWITCPDALPQEYGVYHFRKTFDLKDKPQSFVVHLSADNRYKFYVNGKEVAKGPARSDEQHWFYETIDIAPFLKQGKNVLAALVWNQGMHKPFAQHSVMTGFLLQGNDKNTEGLVNSDGSWKVIRDESFTPHSTNNMAKLRTFVVVGCNEAIDGRKYPWGWETIDFDDSGWKKAEVIQKGIPIGHGWGSNWHLMPRTIPFMDEKEQRFSLIRNVETDNNLPVNTDLLRGTKPLTIPANTTAKLLIDQTYETIGYPILKVSGGKDATIELEYAEALFDKKGVKGNRNDIENKKINGYTDLFTLDGGDNRVFTTLWVRTFRYIQLTIKTGDKPLIINDFYNIFSAYPLDEKASFSSNDASLKDIWNVGYRTARLCAGETYFDCPYYEQLQYVGDTRIQALISLYVSGDDRLMRKAITDLHNSMTPEGLTQSRYPSYQQQMIPPFSLYWVCMVHDYWLHRKDDAFIKPFLPAIQQVLGWYENHIDPSVFMLKDMKWWNFVDWVNIWETQEKPSMGGVPSGVLFGHSSVLTLQYAYTLRLIAPVFASFNKNLEADSYIKMADKLAQSTFQQCFDTQKGVMSDTPLKKFYSQHASIIGVLSGAIPENMQKDVLNKVLTDSSLAKVTFYYRFYLNQALKKAGMANLYYAQLQPWRNMLNMGLTTFAENPEPTRSDCHAWSASPNYDFLATICGIMPSKAGFSAVKIEPAMGELTSVNGKMPHPNGMIEVQLERQGAQGIKGEIILPKGLTGTFIWNGKSINLKEGSQKITL